jgi:hypothetical protein
MGVESGDGIEQQRQQRRADVNAARLKARLTASGAAQTPLG